MPVAYNPSGIRAELRAADDGWVVAVEMATDGSWGHADTTWSTDRISRSEMLENVGADGLGDDQDVIGYVETSLRRAGWRAVRAGDPATPPLMEVWDLSPASDYR